MPSIANIQLFPTHWLVSTTEGSCHIGTYFSEPPVFIKAPTFISPKFCLDIDGALHVLSNHGVLTSLRSFKKAFGALGDDHVDQLVSGRVSRWFGLPRGTYAEIDSVAVPSQSVIFKWNEGSTFRNGARYDYMWDSGPYWCGFDRTVNRLEGNLPPIILDAMDNDHHQPLKACWNESVNHWVVVTTGGWKGRPPCSMIEILCTLANPMSVGSMGLSISLPCRANLNGLMRYLNDTIVSVNDHTNDVPSPKVTRDEVIVGSCLGSATFFGVRAVRSSVSLMAKLQDKLDSFVDNSQINATSTVIFDLGHHLFDLQYATIGGAARRVLPLRVVDGAGLLCLCVDHGTVVHCHPSAMNALSKPLRNIPPMAELFTIDHAVDTPVAPLAPLAADVTLPSLQNCLVAQHGRKVHVVPVDTNARGEDGDPFARQGVVVYLSQLDPLSLLEHCLLARIDCLRPPPTAPSGSSRDAHRHLLDVREAGLARASLSMDDRVQRQIDAVIGDLILPQCVHRYLVGVGKRVLLSRHRMTQGIPPDTEPVVGHLVFSGPPGTGKTSTARLLGGVLQGMGLLQRTTVIEVQREDLVEGHVGGTALKTKAVLQRARGGILFVDEAYRLTTGGIGGHARQDYGVEAVETLMGAMTGCDPVMIFAGYPNDMARFMHANEGLRRRIAHVFEFPPLSSAELGGLLIKGAVARSITLASDVSDPTAAAELISTHAHRRLVATRNASLVDAVLHSALQLQSVRLAGTEEAPDQFAITRADITQSLQTLSLDYKDPTSTLAASIRQHVGAVHSLILMIAIATCLWIIRGVGIPWHLTSHLFPIRI